MEMNPTDLPDLFKQPGEQKQMSKFKNHPTKCTKNIKKSNGIPCLVWNFLVSLFWVPPYTPPIPQSGLVIKVGAIFKGEHKMDLLAPFLGYDNTFSSKRIEQTNWKLCSNSFNHNFLSTQNATFKAEVTPISNYIWHNE